MAQVNTVLGPIAPEDIGVAAMQEYILFGMYGWARAPEEYFRRPQAFEKIKGDLLEFKKAGGGTLVDGAGIALGRDLEFYRALSQSTGVPIVPCTGFWSQSGIPGHFVPTEHGARVSTYYFTKDADYFTKLFIGELTEGMAERATRSDVKAGIIKVANSPDRITPLEEVIYRGAARASRSTGCAVMTRGIRMVRRQLEILLDEEKLDPGRLIIGDCDDPSAIDLERDKDIARRGVCVAYDHVGSQKALDDKRVELVAAMVGAGLADRLLLSCGSIGQALGWEQTSHSYAHLLSGFMPRLRQAGVSDGAVHTILVENPKRVLPF